MATRTVFEQKDVTIRANLKATPDIALTSAGKPFATFALAEQRRVFNEDLQEWEDGEPLWHDSVTFGRLASGLGHLKAGDTVIATGTMKIQEYETEDGSKRLSRQFEVKDMGLSMARYLNQSTPAPKVEATVAPSQTSQPVVQAEAGGLQPTF